MMSTSETGNNPRLTFKTYSHLMENKRVPTDYEIVTSKLHYYVEKGFEINLPIGDWYKRYRDESPFQCKDWEQFSDPKYLIYSTYIELQKTKESFVNSLFQSIETRGYDGKLQKSWLELLSHILPVLRYIWHGLSMVSAYIGQMAPSGRITITCLLQTADEVRRIEHASYRMCQLQKTIPEFGKSAKDCWQNQALWQPLRKLIENLLVTYDWGESFVALNLCVKPILDGLFLVKFGEIAKVQEDSLLQEIFFSMDEDSAWSRAWSQSLVESVLKQNTNCNEIINHWKQKWTLLTQAAVEGIIPC